jgi:hypothetical protein
MWPQVEALSAAAASRCSQSMRETCGVMNFVTARIELPASQFERPS